MVGILSLSELFFPSYVIQLPDIPSYQVDAFLMMLYCTTSHNEGSSWSSTTEMQELVNLLQADFYHPEPG